MKLSLTFFSILFFCFAPKICHSQERLADALLNAKKLNLESNEKWHALLHFEAGVFSSGSSIISESFFLSAKGQQDPSEELNATITAFFKSPNSQCRFPARLMWLKTAMPHIDFPTVECFEYKAYINNITIAEFLKL